MLLYITLFKELIMEKQNETANKKNDRFSNTDRDEATLGVSGNRKNNPGLANEDQPAYQSPEGKPEPRPPEGQPEPRPPEPIMNSTPQSTIPNTNSPA